MAIGESVPITVSHRLREQPFKLMQGNQEADTHSHRAISTHCAALEQRKRVFATVGFRVTERDLTVLRLLTQGLSVKEVGDQLAISGKTVSTHKARLMEKLALASMADLMRYALTHEL